MNESCEVWEQPLGCLHRREVMPRGELHLHPIKQHPGSSELMSFWRLLCHFETFSFTISTALFHGGWWGWGWGLEGNGGIWMTRLFKSHERSHTGMEVDRGREKVSKYNYSYDKDPDCFKMFGEPFPTQFFFYKRKKKMRNFV